MEPETPAASSFRSVALFITVCRVSSGYHHQFSKANPQIVTKIIPGALEQRKSLLIVETSRSDHRLCCATWLLQESPDFHSPPPAQHNSNRLFLRNELPFPLCTETAGGPFCLSFIPQLVRFQIHAEECLVALLCGSMPCGNDAQVWRNLSFLLTHFPAVIEVSFSFLCFLPVSYAGWLPLEHESTLSLPLCSYRENPNSQEMKHTKASASAPLMCPPQLQKKYPALPEHNVVRGRGFDISTGSLIHVLLQQRKTTQADYHSVQTNERGRKEGHPSLRSLINPMLPEGDNRRQKPVTSCVSQDSFIFPSPYVHITEQFLQTRCASGGWRSYLITSRLIKSIIFHFTGDSLL